MRAEVGTQTQMQSERESGPQLPGFGEAGRRGIYTSRMKREATVYATQRRERVGEKGKKK